MPELYHQRFLQALPQFSAAAILCVMLLALLVLTGWQFDIPALKSGFPGLTAMNPGGTALAFLLAGGSLWLQRNPAATEGRKILARIFAGGVLIIAGAWFVGQFFGWDSGPDQMLFREKLDMEALLVGHPNRMAPNTAATFVLMGFALLLLDVKLGRVWVAQVLALGAALVALLTMIGYGYNAMALAGIRHFIPMALNTSVLFFLASLAVLCLRPDRGIMSAVVGAGAGGGLARRLLPVAILVPALVGGIGELFLRFGLLQEAMLLSVFALANIVIFTVLIWISAASLEKADRSRRHAEEELHNAKRAAEDASQAKSDFLASMSHELRTPLNSIIGLNRMLHEDTALQGEHREMAGISCRSAESLLNIVNDILDLSKIEAGALEFEEIVFSLEEVMNNVMEIFLPLCSEKGLILNYRINNKNLPYLTGDPVRLGRVLINLVGNAVKYTEHGSVTLSVTCAPDGDGRLSVRCDVRDTGIGIAPDKLEHIFEKFAQADSSITRRYGGTGLGLNISRYLVEEMGGHMGVESTLGKGAHFWFTISFPTADVRPMSDKRFTWAENPDRLPLTQRKMAREARLLLAEDHLLNQAFMRKLLNKMGFLHFDIADNGAQAAEAVAKGEYDLVLMDCHMPVLSGYDATKQIRAAEKNDGRNTPIIAMTADAMAGTRERCLQNGMDAYISKPINPDELRHTMSRWITFPDENVQSLSAGESSMAFSLSSLLAFAEGAEELQQIISLFISQSEETLSVLQKNCLDGKNHDWTEAAHKLKGGAAVLQAQELQDLCDLAQKMETATTQERTEVLHKISAAYDAVKADLLKAQAAPSAQAL